MPDDARGARPARADAAARRPPRGAGRRRGAATSRSTSRTARAGTQGRVPGGPAGARRRRCALRRPGPYQLQAAIAALHVEAPSAGGHRLGADRRRSTRRWPAIAPSPVVEVNRAVAVGLRGRAGGRARACSSRCSPTRRSPPTSRCTPPTPSCCGGAGDRAGAADAYRAGRRAQRQRRRARRAGAAAGGPRPSAVRGPWSVRGQGTPSRPPWSVLPALAAPQRAARATATPTSAAS